MAGVEDAVSCICCCICCSGIVAAAVILCLAWPLQLWERGDGSADEGALQALFSGALVLLLLAGCSFCVAACVGSANEFTDQALEAHAKSARSGGGSYASSKEARARRVENVAKWVLFVCPPTFLLGFAGSMSAWAAVGDGHPAGTVCGVLAGIFVAVVVPCAAWVSYRMCKDFLDDPGLNLLQGAASAIDDSIERALGDGSLRLLSCAWLLAQEPPLIQRRQDLPESAFVSFGEAVSLHREGRVFVLSYGWLTPDFCDPHGAYLQAIRRFLLGLGARAESCALFWDYACLPQKPRTQREDALFGELLKLMGNLYGSMWRTTVLQHRLVPEAPSDLPSEVAQYNTRPYQERGWCSFEQGAALLAAGHRRKADQARLGRQQPKLIEISGPEPLILDEPEPPTLTALEQHMESTAFTGKGDRAKVMAMLREFNALLMIAAGQRSAKPARSQDGPGLAFSVFGRGRGAAVVTPVPGEHP